MAAQRSDDAGEAVYEIRVMGSLNTAWSDYFDGLSITVQSEGCVTSLTTVTGRVDQAALRGILGKIWDLNLILVSLLRCDQ